MTEHRAGDGEPARGLACGLWAAVAAVVVLVALVAVAVFGFGLGT